jgi:predicted RNA-binding protein YlqC (UPF0109 family)
MSSIDQQFLEYVVKSLVGHPDEVKVERTIDEKGVLLVLTVHPEDLGRVIGRRGSTAQSLRTLLRALGTKNDARYNLKIVDTDKGEAFVANGAPASETAEEELVPTEAAEKESELASKTRKELADLDDLDI